MPTTTAHETLAAAVANAEATMERANDLWRSAERAANVARSHERFVSDLCHDAAHVLEEAKEALAAAG